MTLRCLIVDDSPPFLQAARILLERQGLSVAGMASNTAEALQLARDLHPDVVLVDVGLGEESGLNLAHRLTLEAGAPPVILISTRAEEDYGDLIAGSLAIGFLSKLSLSAAAIRALLDGRGPDPSDAVSGRPGR